MKKLISILDNFGENKMNSKQQVKIIGGTVPPPPKPPSTPPSNGGAVPFKSGETIPGDNGSGGTKDDGDNNNNPTIPGDVYQQIP